MSEENQADLRAYWEYINSPNPFLIAKINSKISKCKLECKTGNLSSLFLGSMKNQELSLRQFLVQKLLGSFNSNRILLRGLIYKKSIALPFPRQWRKILCEEGFNVNNLLSDILLAKFILKNILKGLIEIIKEGSRIKFTEVNHPSARLFDVTINCLPVKKIGNSYDFVSWLDRNGKQKDTIYYHDFKQYCNDDPRIRHSQTFYPAYKNILSRIYFLGWSIFSVLIIVLLMMTGNWALPTMYYEIVRKKRYELGDPNQYHDQYFFTVSSPIYRPIWTEVIEKSNKSLCLINYSTGYPQFKTVFGYTPDEIEYDLMSWPEFLNSPGSFNDYAKITCPTSVKIKSSSYIFWADCEYQFPNWGEKTIALYDVSATSEKYLPDLLPYPYYRSYEIGMKFLVDVAEVAKKTGFSLVYKRKRAFGPVHDEKFANFVRDFVKAENIYEVPPEVSPHRLSLATDVSISIPFTSTGHIAELLGKPSIYYDPSTLILSGDRAAGSVMLISSKEMLEDWLRSLKI